VATVELVERDVVAVADASDQLVVIELTALVRFEPL
jgi:hypothetical protein